MFTFEHLLLEELEPEAVPPLPADVDIQTFGSGRCPLLDGILRCSAGSPGAIKISSTREDWLSFHARACSLPPLPTTSTRSGSACLLPFEAIMLRICVVDYIADRQTNLFRSKQSETECDARDYIRALCTTYIVVILYVG